ncbi:MAG: NUDIX hydrolase [bacterium]|nr:NUDIX hydrolase [bacterium]
MGDEVKDFNERIAGGKGDATVIMPAATVILLRDTDAGPETLMLKKNSKIAFGGMWVFPGGRVDDEDAPGAADDDRARAAAVREANEEASLDLDARELVWFSHWTPPPVEIRRYSTWFFAARARQHDVTIDQGEITDSQWIRPAEAIERHRSNEIQLVPPTFVTLHYLAQHDSVDTALGNLVPTAGPRHYVTQMTKGDDGMVILWEGDAGYETRDASVAGARHRLTMGSGGFVFDDSGVR